MFVATHEGLWLGRGNGNCTFSRVRDEGANQAGSWTLANAIALCPTLCKRAADNNYIDEGLADYPDRAFYVILSQTLA